MSLLTVLGKRVSKEKSLSIKILYKNTMRELPYILKHYNVRLSFGEAKKVVRSKFTDASIVDDYVIEKEIKKGRKMLEETTNLWTDPKDIRQFFAPRKDKKVEGEEILKAFLDKVDGKRTKDF